jgi:threonine aldolase
VWPIETLASVRSYTDQNNIKLLLDGSRILNAIVHYECNHNQIAKYCDVMIMCLTRGLCCPFGSLLFGSKEDVKRARQIRKSVGGGMRQVGLIGAAGLYAFENIIP